MQSIPIVRTALAAVAVSTLSACATSEMPKQPPRFIENQRIESILGEFDFEKGFPTTETTERLFAVRTSYRAVEVMQQNVFAASLAAMRKGLAAVGADKPNKAVIARNLADARFELLTANNNVVYVMGFLDLKTDGPTVIEAPPALLGLLNDMWMRYVGDIGAAGPDKGQGGKFLVLPPGYEGTVPQGYYVFRARTYGVWYALRGLLVDGKTDVALRNFEKLRIYPLAQAASPPPMTLIDTAGKDIYTVHPENYGVLEELGELVQGEYPDAVDGAQKFLLASIGMEFGRPFNPDPKTKAVLEKSALVGAALLRANMWNYTGDQKYIYKDRKWWNPFVGGKYTFDPNGYLDYDAQAFFAAYATGVTPAMATKTVGVGSQYLCTHTDGAGTPLDGAKTYRLRVPAKVPARQFWSFIVYDSGSRSMMATSQRFPAISSYDTFEANADGSVDLYIGPKAPKGKERNWIATDSAKGWTGIFRIYGPEQPFYDQSWKLSDLERID